MPFRLKAPNKLHCPQLYDIARWYESDISCFINSRRFQIVQWQLYSMVEKGTKFFLAHCFYFEHWDLIPSWALEQHCCPIIRTQASQFRVASGVFSKAAVNSEMKACWWGTAWPPPSPGDGRVRHSHVQRHKVVRYLQDRGWLLTLFCE